ncbi:hypothetical protein L484_000513 [Morus notabilis]|uniref:Uncharacterized protein n=1 Tax=Morus notabilis TaxID=981085 RepID=W9T1W0_9ROSA|nr:hypothetical protein L484_000513 [Morus notabilis]
MVKETLWLWTGYRSFLIIPTFDVVQVSLLSFHCVGDTCGSEFPNGTIFGRQELLKFLRARLRLRNKSMLNKQE